ncbi:MAG: hypothetical protein DBY45_04845 [Clostridiales bacterium]|nr:MAG: hypothetical protein DBY45_04845 [Clostridiales bacterium]
MKKSTIAKWALVIILSVFPAYWLCSIAKCEILTLRHGKEFINSYKQNSMIGSIDYLKILDYNSDSARIYYVGSGRSGGDVLLFKRVDHQWIYTDWERTVWSKSGSADGFIWPYIR